MSVIVGVIVTTEFVDTGATLTAVAVNSTFIWTTNSVTDTTIVAPLITTSYTVTATNVFGCNQNTTVQVIVKTRPQPNVRYDPSPDICIGSTVTITALDASYYNWSTNQNTTFITVNPTASTAYTVTATGVNGCTASIVLPVNVHVLPIFVPLTILFLIYFFY